MPKFEWSISKDNVHGSGIKRRFQCMSSQDRRDACSALDSKWILNVGGFYFRRAEKGEQEQEREEININYMYKYMHEGHLYDYYLMFSYRLPDVLGNILKMTNKFLI